MSKPSAQVDTSRLRDQIAMSAVAAFPHLMIINQPEEVAKAIYRLADAVFAERDKAKP